MGQQPQKKDRRRGMYEDCEFYRIPKENGKKGYRTIAVYHGLLYHAEQTDAERFRYRVLCSALLLGSVLLYGGSGILPGTAVWSWYTGLAEGAAVVSLSYAFVSWLLYLTAESEMRAYLYKMTSVNVIRSCKIAAVTLWVSASSLAVSLIFAQVQSKAAMLLCILGHAGAGGILWLLAHREETLPYTAYDSKEEPPAGAEKLDYK